MELIIVFILCACSLIAFVLFGVDKRRAVKHRWRIPEATLLLCSLPGGIGGLVGMFFFRHKTRKWVFRILVPLFAVMDAVVIVFLLWTADYYHAGNAALAALQPDGVVSVEETKTGFFFDGPSEDKALIFYPGAKVDEAAYAPVLRELAEEEMDVYLMRMPLHLAFFGVNAADAVVGEGRYDHYFIGGHSLGGAMAAGYAAEHGDEIEGEILLAAYPTKETAVDTILIYGSEDGVLNMARVKEAEGLVSGRYEEVCIEGGNHAQFGDYGVQAGDGSAEVDAETQVAQTVEAVGRFF